MTPNLKAKSYISNVLHGLYFRYNYKIGKSWIKNNSCIKNKVFNLIEDTARDMKTIHLHSVDLGRQEYRNLQNDSVQNYHIYNYVHPNNEFNEKFKREIELC